MQARRVWTWGRVLVPGLALLLVACDDDGEEGYYEECELSDPDCPDGTTCRTTDGTAGICSPDCTAGGDDCREGYVCHEFSDGTASCVLPCDPADDEACADGYVCDLHEDGTSLCVEPLVMRGEVFDLSTLDPVEGALVVASDETGAAVTDVAVTDAAGRYELVVPAVRDSAGVPTSIYTLRVSAADYLPYPHGIRPAIPIDSADAGQADGEYVLENPTTSVGLIPLPEEEQGMGSIAGTVVPEGGSGALIVAEGGEVPAPYGFADRSGGYVIHNVPAGSYEVRGYVANLQLEPAAVDLADGEDLTGVDLVASDAPLSTISGRVEIVNPEEGDATSVVLVPESTFSDTFVRGQVPPGLRDPAPGLPPDVDGQFEIQGVPDGRYVVLAAFENDGLVRDPDPNIAGTQIVHQTVPDPGQGTTITVEESFKITGALPVISPGAEGPEEVTAPLTLVWGDDSSEEYYTVVVYNAFGELVWEDPDVPEASGAPHRVEVEYGGPLEPGMYYQFRATSIHRDGPISTTEDLRGVFFVAGEVE